MHATACKDVHNDTLSTCRWNHVSYCTWLGVEVDFGTVKLCMLQYVQWKGQGKNVYVSF